MGFINIPFIFRPNSCLLILAIRLRDFLEPIDSKWGMAFKPKPKTVSSTAFLDSGPETQLHPRSSLGSGVTV